MALPPVAPRNGTLAPLTRKGWDRGILDGQVLPGKTRVTRGGVELKKDAKPRAGADGGRHTYHGIAPGELEIEVTTTTDEQLAGLMRIVAPLLPQPKAKSQPKVVAFQHAQIDHLGAINVTVRGVSEIKVPGIGPERGLAIKLDRSMPPVAGKTKSPKNTGGAKPGLVQQSRQASANPPPTEQPGICGPTAPR